MKSLIARPVALIVLLFARAITAVRPFWHEGRLPRRRSIFFANHSSHGDFILIWAVLPPRLRRRVRPVAGADYWLKSKVRGFIGRDVFNAVLIERNREGRTMDPVESMGEAMKEGSSLILFPEGTRNQSDASLQPFKSGLFHLAALHPDFELVPVWIANLNRVMPKGEFVPIPLICTVTFGEPMHLADGEGKDTFLKRARGALLALAPKKAAAERVEE